MTTTRHETHPMVVHQAVVMLTLGLLGLGLMVVTSASSTVAYNQDGNSYSIVLRQLIFGVIGLGLMFVTGRMQVSTIRRFAPLGMLAVIALLIAAQVIGVAVHGQRNWIEIAGPFRIQPSEFAKLAVVVWGADSLAKRWNRLEQSRDLWWPLVPVYALVMLLVAAGRDLGTCIVLLPIMMGMLYFTGAPRIWFNRVIVAALGVVALAVAAAPYRFMRIWAWLHQDQDTSGVNFQLFHGKIALGSGGWTGLGPGASRQKWGTLPEAHTDFIYAVIGEEFGLVGTVAVLLMFFGLITLAVYIARTSSDRFVQLTSMGIAAWFATQSTVNLGAVLGVLPITGVPLPLVSYGGSSLVPSLMAMGLLLTFARSP